MNSQKLGIYREKSQICFPLVIQVTERTCLEKKVFDREDEKYVQIVRLVTKMCFIHKYANKAVFNSCFKYF